MAAKSRSPSQRLKTAAAVASTSKMRSGASRVQRSRTSSRLSFTPRGRRGRAVSAMVIGSVTGSVMNSLRAERAGRNGAADIGVMQRVELDPEHGGLELERGHGAALLLERARVRLHIFEREIGVL